jgi:hypothetical protein
MNEEWAKGWKPAAKSIREDFALVREKFQQTIQIIHERSPHIYMVDKLAQILGANMNFY